MTGTYQSMDWYDAPRYYDMVFAEDTRLEADFLDAALHRYGRSGGRRVLEPACGSGRLVEELARRGFEVTGFDRNERMLDYTRARLRKAAVVARLHRAELHAFEAGHDYDLAHCLVSTFKYLMREDLARSHLRCVASALRPGGLYILGFHLSEYGSTSRTRERWAAVRGDTEVVCNIQSWPADPRRRRERVRARLTVTESRTVRRMETSWWFRTYDAGQTGRLLRSVPELEHVATYDFTYQTDRPRVLDDRQLDVVVILRRRGTG